MPASPDSMYADVALARERHGLDSHLTPLEASLLSRPLGKLRRHEIERGTWNAEAIAALAWSLKGTASLHDWPGRDKLSYSAAFQPSALAKTHLPPWLRNPALRNPRELERAHRIAALWTWRYRAHRIAQGEFLTLAGAAALMDHIASRVAVEARALKLQTELGDLVIHGRAFRHADSLYALDWLAFVYGQPLRHHTFDWLAGRARDWQAIILPTPEIIKALRPAHAPGSWSHLKAWCQGRE